MAKRFTLYVIVIEIINLFCWYYVIVFCSIYIKSSTGWINGTIISLAVGLVAFDFSIPFILACIRSISRKCNKAMYLS